MITDVAAGVKQINDHLVSIGFVARDADGNDFQRGTDHSLRFKTGTSYGEIAVQVVRNGKASPYETIRILTDMQVGWAMGEIERHIATHDRPDVVEPPALDDEATHVVDGMGQTRPSVRNDPTPPVLDIGDAGYQGI